MTDIYEEPQQAWLDKWVAGPRVSSVPALAPGASAPDIELADHTGRQRRLSEFWADGPALVMFWRHFGCRCGMERARRLGEESDALAAAGLTAVIVGQGTPERAAIYRDEHEIAAPILCDTEATAYAMYGLKHYTLSQVLYGAPPEYMTHSVEIGEAFMEERNREGRPMVDDPWLASGEFVVSTEGTVLATHYFQYCEDFPDVRVFASAASS